MIGFLILFLLLITSAIEEEVCERFTSHFDFYNCYEDFEILCPNLGTWPCSKVACSTQTTNGTCEEGIVALILPECCTQKDIRYVDFWAVFNDEPQDPIRDWIIQIYNLVISGKGSNITLPYQDIYTYETELDILGNLTFFSVAIKGYNYTSCEADIELYINGNLTISYKGFNLQMYLGINYLHPYLYIPTNINQYFKFLSAHTIVPSPEDIYWLYTLGPNRTADVEICYESDEVCDNGGGEVSSGYKTATIILAITLGVLLCLMLLLLMWFLYTFFFTGQFNASKKYNEMNEYS